MSNFKLVPHLLELFLRSFSLLLAAYAVRLHRVIISLINKNLTQCVWEMNHRSDCSTCNIVQNRAHLMNKELSLKCQN